MNPYFEFILITSYMVITYHIIALKYRKSIAFSRFTPSSKMFCFSLHVFIVSTNIILYFWLISEDFKPVHFLLRASGSMLFALGLTVFAGSLLGAVYSFVLALVLSHIADAEEEDLRARFGEGNAEYAERVPKLLPRVRR